MRRRAGGAAVVCTARGCGDALARWALYHVRCARFAEAHAYLDDPVEAEDAAKRMRALGLRAAVVRAGEEEQEASSGRGAGEEEAEGASRALPPEVFVVPCDSALRAAWTQQRNWPKLAPYAGLKDGGRRALEVQARQELNAAHCATRCSARGVGWLLHVDADELWFSPRGVGAGEHFEALSAAGISTYVYKNLEGVPGGAGDGAGGGGAADEGTPSATPSALSAPGGDPFSAVTLFRRSPGDVLMGDVSDEVYERVAFWRRRTPHAQYFLGYDNGKAAVCLSEAGGPPVPLSVHEWLPASAEALMRGAHGVPGLDTGGALRYDPAVALGEPVILHFIDCGFEWWWAKYRLLGDFPDSWFGGHAPIPQCFHLASRDAIGRDSDSDAARRLYDQAIALRDASEAQAQIDAGVCERIVGASDLLRAALREAMVMRAALDVTADIDEQVFDV